MTLLRSLKFNEDYYREHAEAGLDYLGHGYWQESYGRMIVDVTQQTSYEDPFIIDAGCACGSILKGFQKTGVFDRVLGMDLADHMIKIGRQNFDFRESELIAGSIASMPVESGTVSLLHSAQVLEHIPQKFMPTIMDEFARVLRPGGRAFLCLDALRTGETVEQYMGVPTHVNIQPTLYWTKILQDRGLLFDVEGYNRFARSSNGPTDGDPRSFYEVYPYWSAWTLIKA